jgi:hypothetical protein
VASARITAPGVIDVGSTDRAEGVRLDASLTKIAGLGHGLPWLGTDGCASIGALWLDPKARECKSAGAAGDKGGNDAIAGVAVVLPDGKERRVRAARAQDKSVTVRDDAGQSARLATAGAQLALGDLDGNGVVEVLTSLDTLVASEDAVVAHSFDGESRLTEKLRVPIPGGVRALAVCPLEGDGIAPIVIATAEGLWIVR